MQTGTRGRDPAPMRYARTRHPLAGRHAQSHLAPDRGRGHAWRDAIRRNDDARIPAKVAMEVRVRGRERTRRGHELMRMRYFLAVLGRGDGVRGVRGVGLT